MIDVLPKVPACAQPRPGECANGDDLAYVEGGELEDKFSRFWRAAA
jgi:hypothetical protein